MIVRTYFKLFILLSVFAGLSAYYNWTQEEHAIVVKKRQELKPAITDYSTVIRTDAKENRYERISGGEALHQYIVGPGKLRIITRYDFPKEGYKASYDVYIQANSDEPIKVSKKTEKSHVSEYTQPKDRLPGEIRNIFLDIPEGVHNLKVYLSKDADYSVNFRFLIRSRKSHQKKWGPLKPQHYAQEEYLFINEKKRRYYPVTLQEGIVVDVTGQTQLRLLTRWHHLGELVRKKKYALNIYEDQKFKFKEEFSSAVTGNVAVEKFFGQQSLVGRKKYLYINVPAGKHQYEIRAHKENDVSNVFIRPFIIKKDQEKLEKVKLRIKRN